MQNSNAAGDITNIYYSVLGLKLLGEVSPNKAELCAAASKLADDSSIEILQAASGAAAALGCPIKFGAKVIFYFKIESNIFFGFPFFLLGLPCSLCLVGFTLFSFCFPCSVL